MGHAILSLERKAVFSGPRSRKLGFLHPFLPFFSVNFGKAFGICGPLFPVCEMEESKTFSALFVYLNNFYWSIKDL